MNETIAATATTTDEPIIESDSLSEHEAQFNGARLVTPPADDTDDGEERGTNGQFQTRHRAKSQQASPDDREAIAELTRRLRTAETEAGLSIERKAGESQRVFELRRKAEIAEAIRDARKAPKTEPPAAPIAAPDVSEFTEKEPTWDDEDITSAADPVIAMQRKWARYELKRDRFEAQQAAVTQQAEAATQAEAAERQRAAAGYNERLAAFTATHPDTQQVLAQANSLGKINPLLEWTLLTDDKSAELVYYFAQPEHHAEFAELMLLSDGRDVTPAFVESIRRRLHAQALAVNTGSAASAQLPRVVSRPPNPVRTIPTKTDSSVPDDDSPLSEHEKHFGPKANGRSRR